MSKYKAVEEKGVTFIVNQETGEKSEATDFRESEGIEFFTAFDSSFYTEENGEIVNIAEDMENDPNADATAIAASNYKIDEIEEV